MPKSETEPGSYPIHLKMLAVQLAGELPGNRRHALFVLRRIEKILDENVYNDEIEEIEAPSCTTGTQVVKLTLVPFSEADPVSSSGR